MNLPNYLKFNLLIIYLLAIISLPSCDVKENNKRSDDDTLTLNISDPILSSLLEKYQVYDDLFDSLEVNLQQHDSISVTFIYLELGEAQRKSGNYLESISFITKALIFATTRTDTNLARIYLGLSSTYFEIYYHQIFGPSYLDTSKYYAEKAFKLSTKINSKLLIANSLNLLGAINIQKGNFQIAKQQLLESQQLFSSLETPSPATLINLAYIFTHDNKLDSALSFAQKSYKKASEINDLVFVGLSLERMIDIYTKLGDSTTAKKVKSELSQLKSQKDIYIQSLFMRQLVMQKEQENNETIISDLNKDKFYLIQLGWLLSIIIAILLVIAFLIYYFLKQNKRLRKKEYELNISSHEQDQLKIKNIALELKNAELEKKELIQGKEHTDTRLAHQLISVTQLESFLLKLQDDIQEKKKTIKNSKSLKLINDLENSINNGVKGSLLNDFELIYKSSKSNFSEKLNEKHANLSANEKRLCYLIAMNMTTKEIATLSHKTYRSVEMARFRLRKKLNLDKNEDLFQYLLQLHKETE